MIRPWMRTDEAERLRPGNAVPVAAEHKDPGHVVLALDMDELRSIAGLGPIAGGRRTKAARGRGSGSARTGRRPLIGTSRPVTGSARE